MTLAPIVLFTYKRLGTLQQAVEALKANYLAGDSALIIFSDAAIDNKDQIAVDEVRSYLSTITGFKSVTINEAPSNKGLANSIIDGVTDVLKTHDAIIVLEDDLNSSTNFLNYMNEALSFYKNELRVFSIAGYSIAIKSKDTINDVYFTSRSSSWGWATWKDRWCKIDWSVNDYKHFKKNAKSRKQFNKMGSDMAGMLDKQMAGNLNSWAIRWCYHQFKHNLLSVHPLVSKIDNIGFNSTDATHTKERFNRFKTILDSGNKIAFRFSKKYVLNQSIIKQFTKPFSIISRIKYKIFNIIK